ATLFARQDHAQRHSSNTNRRTCDQGSHLSTFHCLSHLSLSWPATLLKHSTQSCHASRPGCVYRGIPTEGISAEQILCHPAAQRSVPSPMFAYWMPNTGRCITKRKPHASLFYARGASGLPGVLPSRPGNIDVTRSTVDCSSLSRSADSGALSNSTRSGSGLGGRTAFSSTQEPRSTGGISE